MIYVDQLKPSTLLPSGKSCHLMADTQDELADFAKRLWLDAAWRHGDHFDISEGNRARAVAMGAREVSDRDLVGIRRAKRSAPLAVSRKE
jgi:hypothetical protein